MGVRLCMRACMCGLHLCAHESVCECACKGSVRSRGSVCVQGLCAQPWECASTSVKVRSSMTLRTHLYAKTYTHTPQVHGCTAGSDARALCACTQMHACIHLRGSHLDSMLSVQRQGGSCAACCLNASAISLHSNRTSGSTAVSCATGGERGRPRA